MKYRVNVRDRWLFCDNLKDTLALVQKLVDLEIDVNIEHIVELENE